MYDEVTPMSEYCCKIERAKNGFTVEMRDPKIVAENSKPTKGIGRYRDPNVEYVFKDVKSVLKFLETNLEKAMPMDEFSSAFDTASTKEDD
jgi:hypothetical protein